jgi:hypothetical protein
MTKKKSFANLKSDFASGLVVFWWHSTMFRNSNGVGAPLMSGIISGVIGGIVVGFK